MNLFSRRTAIGMFFSLGAIAKGALASSDGCIIFGGSIDDEIEAPIIFSPSKSRKYYETQGYTVKNRNYGAIIWQQNSDQVAAFVRIWSDECDAAIIMIDTAIDGVYGYVETFWSTTDDFEKLKILPRSKSASSQAKYQSVSRSLADPLSPVYMLPCTQVTFECDKVTYSVYPELD